MAIFFRVLQVTALYSRLKWREMESYLPKLHPYNPLTTRKKLRGSEGLDAGLMRGYCPI